MAIYCGLSVSDSMFDNDVVILRRRITVEEARSLVEDGAVTCVNPSHAATVQALRERFDINISVSSQASVVKLRPGDSLVLLGVRGLPRLQDRHEYTEQEIAEAEFAFSVWRILDADTQTEPAQ